MKEKILKFFSCEIKSVDEEKFIVDAIVSTKKTDRDGDIILPEAFKKNLKYYKDHPILLSSHNYYKLTNQIGRAKDIKIGDHGVEVTFEYFVGKGNEEADWAFELAKKGIAAWSIGFMGLDFEYIEEKDDKGNKYISGRKYTEIELMEISQVLIPSNRGALQNGRSANRIESELFEMAEKSFASGDLKERVVVEVKTVKKEFCECVFEKGIQQSVKVGDICGTCDLKQTDEQKEATKKFMIGEQESKERSEFENGVKSYLDVVFEDRANGSIDSQEQLAGLLKDAFKS